MTVPPLRDPRAFTPEGGSAAWAPEGGSAAWAPEGGSAAGSATTRLESRVLAYDPRAETGRIEAAYLTALRAHGTQLRENGDPYITHPLAVADILAGYRLDVPSICTALLHDTIEDTGLTLPDIDRAFGDTVAGLVDGVTKLTRLELQSDRTKQAENFRKLVLAMSRDIRVLLVKLADRLHNMRTLHFVEKPERRLRIARETMEIYAPLAARIGMEAMHSELRTRAFAITDPEANKSIQARLAYLRGQGADVVEEVSAELARVCRDAGIPVIEVTGREKSPWSVWEKMQRRQVAFEQLSDIMAFRVVVESRDACYAALGAVHAAFPVIAGRFKDYISTAKANGYQSLHTGVTLRSSRNQKIEVQIRTRSMHDFAENGVAAHWSYKTGDDPAAAVPARRTRWVQDLLEILDDSAAPDEFLENTKLALYQDQVFCFTPKGELIQLPRGATPVDFAYAVHSQVGDSCVGAKINGRLMPLRHQLENGDQVEIMTARGAAPSAAWERFVVTGRARARIRRYVAQQQRASTIENGRAVLAKAFRQEGVDGSDKALEPALKALRCATIADLHAAVGGGQIGPRDVLNAVYPELRGPAARPPNALSGLLARPPGTRTGGHARAPITGLVSGMDVHYARCCHPLPGDPIVGIVTTGKGVTIHVRNCATLEGFAATPERFIDVDWDDPRAGHGEDAHVGRLRVSAASDPQALGELAQAIARQRGVLTNLQIVNRQQDFMEMLVDVEVTDLRHLGLVIAGMRAVGGVTQVERPAA